LIPATATAPEMPATRAFSRQLAMPQAAMLKETADEAFKVYRSQGWFLRWGCPRPSGAAASPGPGAAPDGAGSDAGARPSAPAASDDEGASESRPHHGGDGDDQPTSPTVGLETLPPEARA
jgi:hypothetical protein